MRIELNSSTKIARQNAEIASRRSAATVQINEIAGKVRRAFVTDIPGQDMIYLRKEEEARAYLVDPAPNMANYPMLSAEIGVTAPTAYELAQVWLNMSALWVMIASALEGYRLAHIGMLTTATSQEDCDLIVGQFIAAVAQFAAV